MPQGLAAGETAPCPPLARQRVGRRPGSVPPYLEDTTPPTPPPHPRPSIQRLHLRFTPRRESRETTSRSFDLENNSSSELADGST